MTKLAPVVIFLYNRPYQTINTLLNLKKNLNSKNTELIIFSDGYKKNDILDKKKVETVRYIIKNISGFKLKKIILRNRNFGLFKNITSGLDSVFKKYHKAIILEDDILVNRFFLNYMNKALRIYEKDDKVSSVHGWFCEHKKKLPKTFFLKGSDIWGWATWKRSWKDFERNPKKLIEKFNKEPKLIKKFNLMNSYDYFNLLKKRSLNLNQSWGILWNSSNFLKDKYYLNFSHTLCINIGQDFSGTHSTINRGYFNQKLTNKKINLSRQKIKENILCEKIKANFFKKHADTNSLKRKSERIIIKLFKKIVSRKNKITYHGPFDNWISAQKKSKGYNDSKILSKVKKNTLIAKNNIYFFERDGSLLKKNTISINRLHLILDLMNKKKRKLNIIDFGGSLASMYFKIKNIIDLKNKNKWNIVEQKIFAKEGNKTFKNQNLFFFDNINKIKDKKIDLIILSGTLQYVEQPKHVLKKILNRKPEIILIERTPVSINKKQNDIFVQQREDYSYPSWHFSENFIKNFFKINNYDLVDKFSSEFDHNLFVKNQEIRFENYIFKNKNV